jgi:hypothetical protein
MTAISGSKIQRNFTPMAIGINFVVLLVAQAKSNSKDKTVV